MKEKSQIEKNAEERQTELLSTALNEASNAGGHWLNATGKGFPKFYPKGVAVSPFNGLFMALHSDRNGCKTNLFTLYSDAKARGTSVREHEQGVPFLFYNWNKYVHRNNPEDIISRDAYLKLDEEVQKQYKGIHNREIRTLFNIDQTTLPYVDKETYDAVLLKDGSAVERGYSEADERRLHIRFNDFLLKMRDNLVPVRSDGSGMPHYETDRDAVYMPRQRDFEHYNDYVQEALRQIVSATGHQQRLAREGMVMKNGMGPSEDALKQERLIVEVASGIKMLELGLPARLSDKSLGLVDYWNRELKENPNLMDALESDVNNALEVIHKAERGEKIEYATMRNRRQTSDMQEQLPKHFYVADEIRKHPNKEDKTIVIVIDPSSKSADVILPAGASPEVDNEVPGMNKARIGRALRREGIENVRFFNPDGAWGYRPDDTYFAKKQVSLARLKNWALEMLSTLDVTPAVKRADEIGFDQVQMIQDDKNRWALYLKPEHQNGYSIYPDKEGGIWQIWQMQRAEDNGQTFEPLIDVQTRYWFNPAAISQHFIIPGAVTIIMTVIGAILTSLVVAREWERGTMEALLSTEITRTELLLCKLIPYYFLGMLAMLLCMLVSVFILGVPYRGSLLILFFISSLFLLSTLGMGLLISTITRNQFNAAQVALNAAFLPSIMLSGFIFQIDSMPAVIRAVTYIIPARYFVSTLQSLFLAGNIPVVLVVNVLFLIASAVMFIGLTWLKTKRRLD